MSERSTHGQEVPLAFLIGAAFDASVRALHQRLPRMGYPDVRPAHCTNVFRLIDPDGTRPTVLAERAGVSPQAMGEFIDYLQQRGYLVRKPDPSDGRARLVQLTPKGDAAAAAARQAFADIDAQWTALLPPADEAALRRGLRTVAATTTNQPASPRLGP